MRLYSLLVCIVAAADVHRPAPDDSVCDGDLNLLQLHHETKSKPALGADLGLLESEGGDEHTSIFLLDFKKGVDRVELWWFVTIMLTYTIVVDRLQALANYLAEGDRCDEMFVQRVYSELQIFGLVAITLFIGQNLLGHLSMDQFILFEFTDILCSMGACTLILVGVVLFTWRKSLESSWMQLSYGHSDFHGKMSADAGEVHCVSQGFLDFYVMAAHFRIHNNVPLDFDFYLYMRESLSQAICSLVNITWHAWTALLVCCLCGLAHVRSNGSAGTVYGKVLVFTGTCWFIAACELLLYLYLLQTKKALQAHIGTASKEHVERCWRQCLSESTLESAGSDREIVARTHFDFRLAKILKSSDSRDNDVSVVMSETSAQISSEFIQIFSLIACFQLALYVMHYAYNISANGLVWYWHVVVMIPLALSILVLLPLVISTLAFLQGYAFPDPDVLDAMITQSKEFEQDCQYIKDQIRSLIGKPDLGQPFIAVLKRANTVATPTETGSGFMKSVMKSAHGTMQDILKTFNINVSRRRLRRLTDHLDRNNDGTVSVHEFLTGIGADDMPELAQLKAQSG
jgi:hypothetical protein